MTFVDPGTIRVDSSGELSVNPDGEALVAPASGWPPFCACTAVPRADRYVPEIGSRCSTEPWWPEQLKLILDGVDAARCTNCMAEDDLGEKYYKVTALAIDGEYTLDRYVDGFGFCTYSAASAIGSFEITRFADSNCTTVEQVMTGSFDTVYFDPNFGLQIYGPSQNDTYAERSWRVWAFDEALPEIVCTCRSDEAVNGQSCESSISLSGGNINAADGASGSATAAIEVTGTPVTTPDPFPLSDSDWCDLADGTTDPTDDLYREYDFDITVQAELSDGSKAQGCVEVRVQADDAGCPSPTNKGVWIKTGTATVTGLTNMTVDDWTMEWTSSGWKLTLDLTDTTDSSSKTVTLTRDTSDPYLCSGCWGVSTWQSNVRIGDVFIVPVI